MKPAISQVCSLPFPFEKDIADYAAGHCGAVDVWLTKLEDYLATHDADNVRRLLDTNGMSAPVASFQGGLLDSQGEARRVAWELFDRRLRICQAVGIGTLVVACDVAGPLSQQTVERVEISLQQAADQAQQYGVRLALEFQAGSAYINNLQTAAAIVNELHHPALTICLDTYHFYTGRSKLEDLAYLTSENLGHVQFSDLADTPREFAADADRILPGDGDIPFAPIVERLRRIGYEGCVALEVMNPQLWQVPPRQLGEIGITALRKILGLTEGKGPFVLKFFRSLRSFRSLCDLLRALQKRIIGLG